ncbi:MAG TPA: AraC family transcriptional regulator [Thermoanaerobaculia bacterium]|jgi:AraC-like DNA-binding protein|nr:AraC family transcriptional regulator [Thermoanaerobaculia bacterium]
MPRETMATVRRSTAARTSLNDERAWYQRAVDTYLDACYRAGSRATTSEFAERFSLRPPSLTRIFRRLFHQTPLQYFRVRQLQHAVSLLEKSTKTIDEIAVICAFGTRATLHRLFLNQFGIAPEEYRRARTGTGKK